jgi:muramoyltetrapeptide carboxypeptidase
MNMTIPPYLKEGDKVAIVAPARFIPQDKYPQIIAVIESKGLVPVRGKTTYLESGIFAGTDAERAEDMQQMLDSDEIKAIFCLRGGYGTIRILKDLNFEQFINNPKWLVGFSDITVLHATLSNFGIQSIHGQMPINFNSGNTALNNLFDALQGAKLVYRIGLNPHNRKGTGLAKIVGGNVSLICSLLGTPYALKTKGKILFIEDVGEHLYRFDRMMQQLKMAGVLSNLKGLIVGALSDMEDQTPSFGQTAEEIVRNVVKEYSYPVCFGFPAGHIEMNRPIFFNRNVKLRVSEKAVFLYFA